MVVWHPKLGSTPAIEKDAGKAGAAKFDAYGAQRIAGSIASPRTARAPIAWNKAIKLEVRSTHRCRAAGRRNYGGHRDVMATVTPAAVGACWPPPPSRRGTRRSAARCRARVPGAARRRRAAARSDTIESNRRSCMSSGSGGPSLLTRQRARRRPSRSRRTSIGCRPRANSTALATSLSSICAMRSGAPSSEHRRSGGRAARCAPPGYASAIAVDAARDHRRQVEALALDVAKALLEPRRLRHARQDRASGAPSPSCARAM